MKAVIAIFIILFTHYDILRMVDKYGNNMDNYSKATYMAFIIDSILFIYAWCKLIEELNS